MKSFKNFWNVISYPLLYLALQLFATAIYLAGKAVAFALEMGEDYLTGMDPMTITLDLLKEVNIITPLAICSLGFLLIAFIRNRREWKERRFFTLGSLNPVSFILTLVLGVFLNLLTVSIIYFTVIVNSNPSAYYISEYYSGLTEMLIGGNMWGELLVIGIIGPLAEEILFRGIVFDRLKKITILPTAILIQAIIFGCIHGNLQQGFYAAVVGVVMALVYHWSGSFWSPVILHIAYNSIPLVMTYAMGEDDFTNQGYLILLVSSMVISGIIIYLLHTRRRSSKPPDDV